MKDHQVVDRPRTGAARRIPRPSGQRLAPWTFQFLGLVLLGWLGPGTGPDAGAAESIGGQGPARAARSVHLGWPAPDAEVFHLAMVVEQSTPGSYFMACGWNTGYFGIQELGDRRKVAIFSVWDPTTGDDPHAVKSEDRVEILHQDPGVRIKRFGGEGTGGQCMTDFDWALGDTNRFLVRGRPDGGKTAYEGWLWNPRTGSWRHLVTFRTRTGGQPLRGLYSFVEDFRRDGRSVDETRQARFGNGWVRTVGGDWVALTRARFTASGAEWEARDNIDAGPGSSSGWFRLATGGDLRRSRELRSVLEVPPPGIELPAAFLSVESGSQAR